MMPHIPKVVQVYGGIVMAEVICGIWPVVAGIAIKEGFDPIVFIFYRCFGSALVLLALASYMEGTSPVSFLLQQLIGKSKEATLNKQFPWRDFLIMGALTCTNMVGYIVGVAFTSSTQAALMQPVVPVVACLAGLATGSESVSAAKLLGILMSVMGAMFIVYVGQEEADDVGKKAGRQHELGALALVVNVISAAFYYVLQKSLLHRYKPLFLSSVNMVICTCFLLVAVFLYAEEFKFSSWRPWLLTPRREAVLAYAIFFTTTFTFVVLAWANKVTTPSTVTAFNTLQPLITALTGFFGLGIIPHHYTLTGGAAIVGGLLLTVRAQILESSALRQSHESSSLI